MVIYNPDGSECGKIIGRIDLKTADEALIKIWKERIAPLLPTHEDDRWEIAVMTALAAHGYRGDRVE
jgi:hypothetical protein